jgi:hypothetical protein
MVQQGELGFPQGHGRWFLLDPIACDKRRASKRPSPDRPVGAIVFGHFGDRIGRKSMLVTTLMLMGLATFLIGVLPTYGQIGVAARPD